MARKSVCGGETTWHSPAFRMLVTGYCFVTSFYVMHKVYTDVWPTAMFEGGLLLLFVVPFTAFFAFAFAASVCSAARADAAEDERADLSSEALG